MIYLFSYLSWCLIKALKCVQPDLKITANFCHCITYISRAIRWQIVKMLKMLRNTGFIIQTVSLWLFSCLLSQCYCRRGCSRANLPPACLIWWITFRGWKQMRQWTWVSISVKCCCCSLIWTPVHWEQAQNLQSSLTQNNGSNVSSSSSL